MDDYTQEEIDEFYEIIVEMLKEDDIVKKVIEKGIPTRVLIWALTDQLGLACLAEGKHWKAGDLFLKLAIEKLQSIQSGFISRTPPYDQFHESMDN